MSGRIFKLKEFLITAVVFLIVVVLTIIPLGRLEIINPVGKALRDFDSYDLVFSKLRNEPAADTNIVLVNIGNLDRPGLARQILKIGQYNPKVIGLDAFFYERKDNDSSLAEAFLKCPKVVLVSRLDKYNEESDSYDTLIGSAPELSRLAVDHGYANLPDENEGYKTVRHFRPAVSCMGKKEYSFAASVVKNYDKHAFEGLLERGNDTEIINYRGQLNKFYCLDVNDLSDTSARLSFLKDKIVLMGFMGIDLNTRTFEDVFFTPLNQNFAGRTFPDMHGIVIHANIISMILSGNYVNENPEAAGFIAAFLICYLNVLTLNRIKSRFNDWFGGMSKLLFFCQTVIFTYFSLQMFNYFNYKFSLTLILASIFLIPAAMDLYGHYLEKGYLKMKKILIRKR